MKALCKQTMGFILMILLACGVTSIKAQDSADDEFITVSGVVKDKQTRKKLEYVNISIPGTNVGTITNNDGEFSIKVKNGPPCQTSRSIAYRIFEWLDPRKR